MSSKLFRQAMALGLSAMLLGSGFSTAQKASLKGGISVYGTVNIVPESKKVSLNLRDASLRDVLNLIAQQGNINLILDESVTGSLTVDIKNISINKAYEYLFKVANLSYVQDGNTLIVASREAANTKNLNAQTFTTIPVVYKDAGLVSQQLNTTLFSVTRPGGSGRAIASFDPDANSIIVMGTDTDISLVKEALKTLDVPRARKTYEIKYSDPMSVAQVLAANFFGFGTMSQGGMMGGGMAGGGMMGGQGGMMGGQGGMMGGGMAPGGAAPGGMAPGGAAPGGAAAGGMAPGGAAAGGMAAGGAAPGGMAGGQGGMMGGQGGMMGGGMMGGASTVFTSGGVTFIGEPTRSTLTVMGSTEQIALIDSLIDQVDIRRPQVAIEMSLVEFQSSDLKRFVPQWGSFNFGQWFVNILPGAGSSGSSLGWFNGRNADGSANAAGNPANKPTLSGFNLDYRLSKLKGKVLANPNVVALDGTASSIEITDEVPTIAQTTTVTATGPVVATTITKEQAGITLNVTPRITNDGSVTLTLNPTVTQPIRLIEVEGASTFLISERSVNLASVRVKDGETLIIGGLVRETQSTDIREVPGLANLPVVGAMFRAANNNQKERTELVLMITPHILQEDATFKKKASVEGISQMAVSEEPVKTKVKTPHLSEMPLLKDYLK
jgi:type II secretory pathway component GspD/PulD (secretin)